MTTDEAKLCECGCGKVANMQVAHGSIWADEHPDMAGAWFRIGCGGTAEISDRIRSNRRRSRPAELEALEFVAPRDLVLQRRDAKWDGSISIRAGRTLRFSPDGEGFWIVRHDFDGSRCCVVIADDVPRIHAELVALRDGTGFRDTPAPQGYGGFKPGDTVAVIERYCDMSEALATVRKVRGDEIEVVWLIGGHTSWEHACEFEAVSLQPSEDPKRQPEANPLDYCVDCGADRLVAVNADGYCAYCAHRAKGCSDYGWQSVALDDRIASATPKEAERREVWDWPVDSDAPDGCA